jgi:hypothetical protein
MHPARIHATRKRSLLILVLALGMGFPPPAQAYLLDFTVASINPGVLISYAGSCPSGPPLAESNLKLIDLSRMGEIEPQLNPTITLHNKNLNFQTGPLVDYFANVHWAPYARVFGGISPQGSLTLQGGIPSLTMSDGTTLLSGSLRTASVMEPVPVGGHSFSSLGGSNSTDNKNDTLLAFFGILRQSVDDNINPGFAGSFASAPGAFTGTMVPSGNILNHIAPFSSTLLLLGTGLTGLVGLRYRRRRG